MKYVIYSIIETLFVKLIFATTWIWNYPNIIFYRVQTNLGYYICVWYCYTIKFYLKTNNKIICNWPFNPFER